MSGPSRPGTCAEIDWTAARTRLRTFVSGHMSGRSSAAIEDVTQDAMIRTLRFVKREVPNSLEAVMRDIASKTVKDYFRSRYAGVDEISVEAEPVLESLADDRVSEPEALGFHVERVRFLVKEFLKRQNRPSCLNLANAFFAGVNWKELATRTGKTHAAIRRQWSRCVEALREAAKSDPAGSLLAEWARAGS